MEAEDWRVSTMFCKLLSWLRKGEKSSISCKFGKRKRSGDGQLHGDSVSGLTAGRQKNK